MGAHALVVIAAKEGIEPEAFGALSNCKKLGVAGALLWFGKDA
jgi:hypothetical protein